MDILKVLSRGTRPPQGKKTGAAAAAAAYFPGMGGPADATLPSAGASIHPQLFHDPVGGSRKRKRNGAKEDASDSEGENDRDSDDDDKELDFFAEASSAGPAKKTKKTATKTKKTDDRTSPQILDEDECRQILRSHRLKVTLLTDRGKAAAAEGTKEKSKKKKAKAEAEATAAAAAAAAAKKPFYPQPLTAFSQLRHTYRIAPRLADNLDRLLYRIPTEVQMASLPLLLEPALALSRVTVPGVQDKDTMERVDLMALAPTGSGKTLSFLVPAIDSVLKRRAADGSKAHVLDTIVVAPTRELAHQIAGEGKRLAAGTGVRVVAMRKGVRVGEVAEGEGEDDDNDNDDDDENEDDSDSDEDVAAAAAAAKKRAATPTKADILVTTPLLLLHALGGPANTTPLPTVRTLVLDEADVLLDALFRDQTLGLWRACTHPALRVTFWSATMPSSIEALVAAERRRETPLLRLVVGLKDSAVPNVAHRLVYTATEQGKLLAMRQLLHPATSRSVVSATSASASASPDSGTDALRPPFLVFTQTAARATALHDELQYDIPAAAGGAARLGVLHAALSESARAAVVRRFRAGLVWVLITTDVLARGIDFAGVNGVVHYDVPGSAAAYVHRAGRTGRAGRRGGLSVTLYTKADIPVVKSVANVIAASERQAGTSASSSIPQWLLDALPDVSKEDRQKLKRRGVESRRTQDGGRITSKSAWDRRRANNRREAIAHSKEKKKKGGEDEGDEWKGID